LREKLGKGGGQDPGKKKTILTDGRTLNWDRGEGGAVNKRRNWRAIVKEDGFAVLEEADVGGDGMCKKER